MPAKDLGNKYVCFKCGTKFYDMKKPDPLCPKCGADQRDSPALKAPSEGRRSRLASMPKAMAPLEPEPEEAEAAEEEDEVPDFEEEDSEELGEEEDI